MTDINCIICSEPWDAYGARHADMAPWEYDLFKRGAGCPCCEGKTPQDTDPEEIAYHAAKQQVFCGTDDDELVDNFVAIADGLTTSQPQWKRPDNPVLWECNGCDTKIVRDLDHAEDSEDGVDLEYRDPYYCSNPGRVWDGFLDDWKLSKMEEWTIGDHEYCPNCVGWCDECTTPIFHKYDSHTGKVLYGDTYDPGASFPNPKDCYSQICVDCLESIPTCCYCGEYDADLDAEGYCEYCKDHNK